MLRNDVKAHYFKMGVWHYWSVVTIQGVVFNWVDTVEFIL